MWQRDRQTDKQTDKQTDRQTNTSKNNTFYHFVMEVINNVGWGNVLQNPHLHWTKTTSVIACDVCYWTNDGEEVLTDWWMIATGAKPVIWDYYLVVYDI